MLEGGGAADEVVARLWGFRNVKNAPVETSTLERTSDESPKPGRCHRSIPTQVCLLSQPRSISNNHPNSKSPVQPVPLVVVGVAALLCPSGGSVCHRCHHVFSKHHSCTSWPSNLTIPEHFEELRSKNSGMTTALGVTAAEERPGTKNAVDNTASPQAEPKSLQTRHSGPRHALAQTCNLGQKDAPCFCTQ